MSWIGRIVGVLLGWAMGKWLGAIIGFAVGHYFDRAWKNFRAQFNPEQRRKVEQAMFHTIFPLMGRIAKADGRVSEEEIQAAEILMDRMGLADNLRAEAKKLFKQGVQPDFDLASGMGEFIAVAAAYPHLKQLLLVYLITMAMSDHELHDNEIAVLREVALLLGYSDAAFNHLLRMVQAQARFQQSRYYSGEDGGGQPPADKLASAYEALGVSADTPDDQIKKAYRKLMSQHHPDKLVGQGVPEEMVKVATERSQEIQAAYDLIKKSRA